MFFTRNMWFLFLVTSFFSISSILFGKSPFYFYNAHTLDSQETLVDVGITKDNEGLAWVPYSSFVRVHYGLFESSTVGTDLFLFLRESPNVFLKHKMFDISDGLVSFSSLFTYADRRKELAAHYGFTYTVEDKNNSDITIGLFDVYNSFYMDEKSFSSHRFLGFFGYDWKITQDFIFSAHVGLPLLTTTRSSLLLKRTYLWFQTKHINFSTKEIIEGPYSSVSLSKVFGPFKIEVGFLGYELTNVYPYASSSWRL